MDDTEATLVLDWYVELESRLSELLKVVPYSTNTTSTFLPSVSSIVLEAASLLDTILRSEYTGAKKKRDLTFPDYAIHYEPLFHCSSRHSVLFLHPVSYLTPFEGWLNSSGSYSALFWWTNYNKLKHNRIQNYQLSTLGTALNAVCALHQFISLLPCFATTLFRRDLMNCGGFNPQIIADLMLGKTEKTEHDWDLVGVVETELFCSSTIVEMFPDDLEKLRPWSYRTDSQLFRYLSY